MNDNDDVAPPFEPEEAISPEEPSDVEMSEGASTEVPRFEPPPAIPWRLGLFLLLAVVVVVFSVQNTQDASLHFLGWSWELPLVIIILMTVVVSVLLDEVLGGIIKRRRRRRHEEREELRRLRDRS
ncbi:MAG: lipopolysaccharide assembly protein LapA domain-containing protein [Acidimicrobiia bacterium]